MTFASIASNSALAFTWAVNIRLPRTSFHPGETAKSFKFIDPDLSPDYFENDKEFWESSGKLGGMIKKHQNAVLMVQLFRNCSGIPEEDVIYLSSRSNVIALLIGLSVAERFARIFLNQLPHLCARSASYLFWEIELRAQTLSREYDIEPRIY